MCVTGEERQICKIICKTAKMIQLTEPHTELLSHCWWILNRINKIKRRGILTGGKKPEKWLKGSCLLTGRTSTVRLFSLSVQERSTPRQPPELRTPSSRLEVRRGKVIRQKRRSRKKKKDRKFHNEETGKTDASIQNKKGKQQNKTKSQTSMKPFELVEIRWRANWLKP